ncbi:MAG: immune inhibitor A [Ignavibacteria bacterium]|nr:immune inhibitor A [Ignavibacteria bacterium]
MKIKLHQIIFASVIILLILIGGDFNAERSDKSAPETYSLVKIYAHSPADILKLQMNDITVEHYTGNIKEGIEVVINEEEISRLKNSGLEYEIKILNLDSDYSNRKKPSPQEMQKSFEIMSEDNIQGFSYGSMGGYYTYSEVVQKLDSMRLQFPNIISVKQNLGLTHQSRNIWAVKISDNPDVSESSSEAPVYFDALHHAREPQSMASVMYFMYWLLENYGTNPEVTYLVNNREIYFIPVANPDGYVYNQTTNPGGGGSWRKNRRNNGSCFGVDLNRNYTYGWGFNSGSSNNPCSDTYRGPSAGSEPEVQAIKNFIDQIRPEISFSFHSVAGRYLNPYGYTDTIPSYEIYSEFSSDFASHNNYTYGTVSEMLEYYSSGTTRDYLHSIGSYCWTPEVGGSGFWPLQSEIIPIANENLYGIKYLCWVGGAFADYLNYKISGKGFVHKNDTLSLQITLKNRGLSQTAKNVSVDVTSLYANATAINSAVNFDSIQPRQYENNSSDPFKFKITSSAVYMDEMKFLVSVKQEGVETSKDTIRIIAGKTKNLYSDNAETGTSHWSKSGTGTLWDTTFIDPHDGNKNFADSRYGNSKNNSNNYFTLNDTVNLTGAANPRIEFAAKWAGEVNFDYTRIQVSTNFGSSWTNLPGRYTRTISGQPSFADIKYWVNEQINLNTYIGKKIKLRFNLFTDAGIPGDGFYFDNFRVVDYADSLTKNLQLNLFIQGRYNEITNSMSGDTLQILLRNNVPPFSLIDSAKNYQGSSGIGSFNFPSAVNGIDYYIIVKHRNSIETWSSSPGQRFVSDELNYNFTTSLSQAFGGNLSIIDSSPFTAGVYTGDIDRDGAIDVSDVLSVYNDAGNFVSGYVITDLTGDNFVDSEDLILAFNNSNSFVSVIRP